MPVKQLRSLLFLPATATHMMAKATARGADALVVDLEDSIPAPRKPEARPLAAAAIAELAGRGATVVLRVNADPALWQADLASMPRAMLNALSVVMLPKVETRAQLDAFALALTAAADQPPLIAALLETPRGVLAAAGIATHPQLCALGFGAEDYAAALGVAPDPVALSWPAQQVLTCAHAYSLQCWGLAASIAVIDDMDAFGQSVRMGRAMGFTGTVCIHPRQVEVANRGFSPSEEELAWARRVVAADAAAQAAGQGAIMLDGRMIDLPIVDRAKRWLEAMQQA